MIVIGDIHGKVDRYLKLLARHPGEPSVQLGDFGIGFPGDDRALIALMIYSFARVGAAPAMRVDDVYTQNQRMWVRLHEKSGKYHAMPCHHSLEAFLAAYIDGAALAGDLRRPLFCTVGRGTGRLTRTPLPQANAHAMIRRRA